MVLPESGCCYQSFLSSVGQMFITGFLQDFLEIFIFNANNLPDSHALVLGCVSLGQFSQTRINWLHKTAETLAQASAKRLSPHRSVTYGAIQLCPCNDLWYYCLQPACAGPPFPSLHTGTYLKVLPRLLWKRKAGNRMIRRVGSL